MASKSSFEFKANTYSAFIALCNTVRADDENIMLWASEAATKINACFPDGSVSVTAATVLNKVLPSLYRYAAKADEMKLSSIATFRRYVRESMPMLSATVVTPEAKEPKAPKAPKAKKAPDIEKLGLTPAQLEQLKIWMEAANKAA